jgi:hypothetical protein
MGEIFTKINSNTLEVTHTKLIQKDDLIAQKKDLEFQIKNLNIKLDKVIDKIKSLEAR